MVQLKTVLDTRRQKSDGTYPIVFRITDVKKVHHIPLGISVIQEMWDENNKIVNKKHPNALSINAALSKKLYRIQKTILALVDEDDFSFEKLKSSINPTVERKPVIITPSFKEFTQALIADMFAAKKVGNAIVYQTAMNRLLSFSKNDMLTFKEMDYSLLEKFKSHLTANNIKVNSISNYFRTLRAIYNKAIKAKVVDRTDYPFQDVTIKSERTAKRAITRQDIVAIERLDLKLHSPEWNARNYFLLSFYLIGVSFTDLAYLKKESISNDGRIEYRRRKTHKLYSIKIFSQAQAILNHYTNPDSDYLLPILNASIQEDSLVSKKIIYQWIKTSNKYLKRIAGNQVTTYVARHTWATTAKRLGYSNELIAEALGHEYGNKITNIYLDDFDKEVIDEMHEKVIY